MKQFFLRLKEFFGRNDEIADVTFTLIILFISTTSFFHVMEYWKLTNKVPFYIITAIATELVIIGAMFGIKYTRVAWFPFILGVLVQSIGNIFYSFINIDVNSDYFKQFMDLFKPWFELSYGDELEISNYKRVLAYSNGLFYLSPIVFLWAKLSLKKKVLVVKAQLLADEEAKKSSNFRSFTVDISDFQNKSQEEIDQYMSTIFDRMRNNKPNLEELKDVKIETPTEGQILDLNPNGDEYINTDVIEDPIETSNTSVYQSQPISIEGLEDESPENHSIDAETELMKRFYDTHMPEEITEVPETVIEEPEKKN